MPPESPANPLATTEPFRCCRAGDINPADIHAAHPSDNDPHYSKPAPRDFYQDVLDFHRKFGCLVGHVPAEPDSSACLLRERLIDEERRELRKAMAIGDIPGVADAIGDLVYVLLGTAVAYGIDIRPVWAAIQAANMAKEGGGTRADGKIMKPVGWTAPDIEGILKAQGWGSSGR
jgi:predicted HAD superfamily Cof-like phosphohydrolase